MKRRSRRGGRWKDEISQWMRKILNQKMITKINKSKEGETNGTYIYKENVVGLHIAFTIWWKTRKLLRWSWGGVDVHSWCESKDKILRKKCGDFSFHVWLRMSTKAHVRHSAFHLSSSILASDFHYPSSVPASYFFIAVVHGGWRGDGRSENGKSEWAKRHKASYK